MSAPTSEKPIYADVRTVPESGEQVIVVSVGLAEEVLDLAVQTEDRLPREQEACLALAEVLDRLAPDRMRRFRNDVVASWDPSS